MRRPCTGSLLSMALMLVVVPLEACETVNITGASALQALPESRGTDLGLASSISLAWSPAYDQLLFVSPDYRSALAYTLSVGSTRELATVSGEQVVDVSQSFDGQESFTTAIAISGAYHRTSRRHSTAGTTALTSQALGGLRISRADGSGVLPSPARAFTVFLAEPDSAFVLRRGEPAAFVGTGCIGAVAFSPDESRVLCMTVRNNEAYGILRLADGVMEPLALPSDIARYARLFRWDGGGIRLLYSAGLEMRLYNVTTGTSRAFLPVGTFDEFITTRFMSWSSDGRKVAYATLRCAGSRGFNCATSQGVVYVYDVSAGTSAVVAVHTLSPTYSSVDQVALSRAGDQVAYVVNGHLFLAPVR